MRGCGVVRLAFSALWHWRNRDKAEREALAADAARIARNVMRWAQEDGVQTATFYCEEDGWTTTASSEATLTRRLREHYQSPNHTLDGWREERRVIPFSFDRLRLLRDPYKVEREAQVETAVELAREVMEGARAEGADEVTFRCGNDGWVTTVTTETMLRQRIQQHYRSARHKP